MSTATVATSTRRKPTAGGRRPLSRVRIQRRQGWVYASPVAALVLTFFVIPIVLVFVMSASDWGLLSGNAGFNFPENFDFVLNNRLLWPSVRFTLLYTVVATALLITIGLGLALIIQETTRWNGMLRTVFLLPTALGLGSASLLFWALYSPQISPLTGIFESLGLPTNPLSTPTGALWSTVALIVWRFAGFYMLLILVGLQNIPGDVYEAARVDGANRWTMFREITIPLLRPSLALATIMSVTGSLLAFEQFFILTQGGPDLSTMTVVQLIFNIAFASRRHLGAAAALSVLVMIALVVINSFQFRMLRRND